MMALCAPMNRRWCTGAAAVALATAGIFAGCSGDDTVAATSDAGSDVVASDVANDAPGQNDSATPTEIQILDISDWHGQVDPNTEATGKSYGGLGVLMAYFAKEKATNPNTLIVTAGDAFGATPALSTFSNDEPAVKGLGLLGVAFDTFGNHNFDLGTANTKRLVELASPATTYVSTNLENVAAELGSKVVVPYATTTVGGVKIAVVGLTNPDAPSLLFPGRMGTLKIDDAPVAANAAATKARAEGAQVVIALAHEGVTSTDPAPPSGPLMDLASKLQGIDVLFGDHTDHQLSTTVGGMTVTENRSKGRGYTKVVLTVANGAVTKTTVTQTDAQYVDQASLGTCDGGVACTCPSTPCPTPASGTAYTCSASGKCQRFLITPDPAAETMLAPYRAQLATKFDVTAGTIDQVFARDGSIERTRETQLGDFVADALLAKYKTSDGAQIAFTNGGGLRSSLPSSYAPQNKSLRRPDTGYAAGPPYDLVTGDPYGVLPFGNLCVVRKITGQLLWQVLEHSVGTGPAPTTTYGGFLQIAGFKFSYNSAAPVGSKVTAVTLDGGTAILKDATEYTLVTNDFTNAGGDGYTMLVEASPSAGRDVMADVVLEYMKAQTAAVTTPSAYGTRIIGL